jgi:hypothetical protein
VAVEILQDLEKVLEKTYVPIQYNLNRVLELLEVHDLNN